MYYSFLRRLFAARWHRHPEFSPNTHDHDADYAPVVHPHEHSDLVGEITLWAGQEAAVPSGWLLCNGAAVSRTTYAALFAAISTTYGPGNGSTTFNLPDLVKKFPIGAKFAVDGNDNYDYTLGKSGGEENHTLTVGEMPLHSHTMAQGSSDLLFTWTFAGGGNVGWNAQTPVRQSGNTGGGYPHNNIPPFLSINFIIRY